MHERLVDRMFSALWTYTMGSCVSCSGTAFSPSHIETIESSLSTGDLVWLAGKGTSKFMFRAGKWRMFSRVGVLVRSGPGLEGLQLCVAQDCLTPSTELPQPASDDYITIGSLADELSSGLYKQVAVTRLANPLSEAERELAFSFCNGAIGQQLNQKVPLCVNPSTRVFCNQLAADMLVSCGRVALVDQMYGPAKSVTGQLLLPPVFMSVASKQPSSPRKRVYSTPMASFAADKDTGSQSGRTATSAFRDVHDQHEVFYSVHSLIGAEDAHDTGVRSSADSGTQPSPGSKFSPLAAALPPKQGGVPSPQPASPEPPGRVVASIHV